MELYKYEVLGMIGLNEAIKTANDKMRLYRSYYEANESAVRGQIIDPILKALGWNTDDPEDVRTELVSDEGFSDYCLFKNKRKILCVEAKNLSKNVEDKKRIHQLAKYCFNDGMEYGIITNGAIWILFKSFQQGIEMEKRRIWKVDIENDDVIEINRKFNTISKENITKIDDLAKEIEILDEIWHFLLNNPSDFSREISIIFNKFIRERYPTRTLNQREMEYFIEEVVMKSFTRKEEINCASLTTKPIEKTLPISNPGEKRRLRIGNDTYEFKYSTDILVITANWLIKENKITKEDCPISSGRKRNLINTESKHITGKDFFGPRVLSNDLYIETNYSAPTCEVKSRFLLERFGYSKDMLEILN